MRLLHCGRPEAFRAVTAVFFLVTALSVSAPAGQSVPATDAPLLTGLLIIPDPKAVMSEGTPNVKGVEIRGIELLDRADFKARMAGRLGSRLTDENRAAIVEDIVRFLRGEARVIADVSLPPQEITGGVLQVLVLQSKVGRVRVQGGRWHKQRSLTGQISAKPGQDVDARQLIGDLDWLNRNPFRQVSLVYAKGAEFGQTDLVLEETERFPLRAYPSNPAHRTVMIAQTRCSNPK